MAERRIVKLERLAIYGPGKDRWFIRAPSRHRPWTWFKAEAVPPVDAHEAYFELERVRGGWKVLRQVDEPTPIQPEARRWPRAPRTLAECRRSARCRLSVLCVCSHRWESPRDLCRAFDGWTIEALQRAGYWRCRCGQSAAAVVHDEVNGHDMPVEFWSLNGAYRCWIKG